MFPRSSNRGRVAATAIASLVTLTVALGVFLDRSDANRGAASAVPCATGSATTCAMPSGSGRRGGGGLSTGGQPRLLEFTSASCAACARMAPIVDQVERRCLAEADGSLVHVSIDEPEGEALAERYEVRALPTFVGIDAQGAEVLRMVGVQTREKLASALGEVRGRACPPI
ncbi:thioredoxin family protein [Polyangium sp. 15x6]|uniref:thioredoxin family protein n=1 Tax=Polyangium sp. 15x6 TaxID=3042687 RepID=UPI0032B32B44